MSELTVKVSVPTDKKLEYKVTEEVASGGKAYKLINSEPYQIAIFPTSGKADPNKGSNLYANARVTLKAQSITFQMVVKKLKNGELIAGQPGRLNGHRAVVTEWDGEKSFERMSIPNGTHKEIMSLISAACV